MSSSKKKDKTKIEEARGLLIQLTELTQDPSVRNDPVVKNLIIGLAPKTNEFATASLAVSTLRSAGCIDQPQAENITSKPSDAGKAKTTKEKKDVNQNKTEQAPKEKVRSLTRTIDLLLEDAVWRGEADNKTDHPLAKGLFKLRSNAEKTYTVETWKPKYDEGTYANGKTYKKFIGLETQNGSFVPDETKSVMVKDLADWDLLAIASPELLRMANELGNKLFSWTAGNYKIPENPTSVWKSLKGTPLIDMILGGDVTQGPLLAELEKLPWAKFGPSKTLKYK